MKKLLRFLVENTSLIKWLNPWILLFDVSTSYKLCGPVNHILPNLTIIVQFEFRL